MTRSWNPFVGCLFKCVYCKPSFQDKVAIYGRKNGCSGCLYYTPHCHENRLNHIPSEKTIAVCLTGDVSFCPEPYMLSILEKLRADNREGRVFLIQSKNPVTFEKYLRYLPANAFLLTTLETNRDYPNISKAPSPSKRYKDFQNLNWKNVLVGTENKIVNIEPIMDFDMDIFTSWITEIKPIVTFIGYNSRPYVVHLPEPSIEKTFQLAKALEEKGIRVMFEEMRGHAEKQDYKDFFEDTP